jgi:hypothetical protein
LIEPTINDRYSAAGKANCDEGLALVSGWNPQELLAPEVGIHLMCRFRPSSGQVLCSPFIHQRLSGHDARVSKVVLILLIWAGPAFLLLAVGVAAVARARLTDDRRKKQQSAPRVK